MTGRRAGPALRLGGVTLIPISETHLTGDARAPGFWIAANMAPVALVIVDGHGSRAQDMAGRRLDLQMLAADLPELNALLNPSAPP